MIHLAATLLLLSTKAAAPADSYDVIVYGGSPAGVMAAVEAGGWANLLLIEPGRHLGGLLSGGRMAGEPGQPGAIGGLSREFYLRVAEEYRRQVPRPSRRAAPHPCPSRRCTRSSRTWPKKCSTIWSARPMSTSSSKKSTRSEGRGWQAAGPDRVDPHGVGPAAPREDVPGLQL